MRRPARPRRAIGLTLIEIMIALAVLAILATMAVPTLGERLARMRLASVAETLALDLSEARLEAAQSGQTLYVVFQREGAWCYAVARSPACTCGSPQPCQLKVERAVDWPGVDLLSADDVELAPGGAPDVGARISFRGAHGQHDLQVSLSALGRASVCTSTGMPGQVAC